MTRQDPCGAHPYPPALVERNWIIPHLCICAQVIEGLGLTHEQFIDMCILCGCDYCGSIKG